MKPSILLIFHLQAAMEMMTKRSMMKRSTMAQNRPLLLTATGCKLFTNVYKSHGNGNLKRDRKRQVSIVKLLLIIMQPACPVSYPTVMSKMLEPTELDTAMSPRPFRATMTLVMRSGMEVPAARIVSPMISSVMPMVSPTCAGDAPQHGVSTRSAKASFSSEKSQNDSLQIETRAV